MPWKRGAGSSLEKVAQVGVELEFYHFITCETVIGSSKKVWFKLD